METKHCPTCNATELLYQIDIFKKGKDRYTGDVQCENCKSQFKIDNIKIRYWKEEVENKEAHKGVKNGKVD